jgi:hypothetical protein
VCDGTALYAYGRQMIYKAFVSSTFEDLKEHRQHVISLLRAAGFSVDPMEDWTASQDEPKAFSVARIQGCHLCVLLVAFRRGYIPAGESRSITQLEYEKAKELGCDILVFMLDDNAPWPRRFDDLSKDSALEEWRAQLMEERGVSFFGLAPDSIEIRPALTRWLAEQSNEVRLAGTWRTRTTWSPRDERDPGVSDDIIVVQQNGNAVSGQAIEGPEQYSFTGRIVFDCLIGEWKGRRLPLQGVYQLKIDIDSALHIEGYWIGNGAKSLYFGEWIWDRIRDGSAGGVWRD